MVLEQKNKIKNIHLGRFLKQKSLRHFPQRNHSQKRCNTLKNVLVI